MQNFAIHRFRKVIILGLLAGLVFSCAEGISLLPFPPSGGDSSGLGAAPGAEENLSYIKSFEEGRSSVSSRSKRSAGDHFLAHPHLASVPPFYAVSSRTASSLTDPLTPHAIQLDQRLPVTRGPPVFFSI